MKKNNQNQIKVMKDLAMIGVSTYSFTKNEEGYSELIRSAQTALDALDDDFSYHYLEEIYDDYLIFRVSKRNGDSDSYYRSNYTVDESDGSVKLTGDPQKVVKQVEYPIVQKLSRIHNKKKEGEPIMSKEQKPCCPDVINGLINSSQTEFTEDDRSWLEALNESQMKKLTAMEEAIVANAEKKSEPLTQEKAVEALSDTLKDPKKFMQLFPKDVQEKMQFGFSQYDAHRAELIAKISANEIAKEKFPEEKLNTMTIGDLEAVASLIQDPVDYSVQSSLGNPQVNSDNPDDILLPPGVVVNKETK